MVPIPPGRPRILHNIHAFRGIRIYSLYDLCGNTKFRVLFPQLLASPNSGIFAPGWDVDVAFRPTPSRDLSHCGTQAHGGDGVCPGLSVLLLFLLDHIHLAIYPLTLPTPRPLLQPFSSRDGGLSAYTAICAAVLPCVAGSEFYISPPGTPRRFLLPQRLVSV